MRRARRRSTPAGGTRATRCRPARPRCPPAGRMPSAVVAAAPRPLRPAPRPRPRPTAAPAAATVHDHPISASGIAFDTDTLEVPADTPFEIVFANNDAGIPHNVAIHEGCPTGPEVWTGEIFNGVETRTYDVPALPAGTYGFVCTVHPNMTGTLTAKVGRHDGGSGARSRHHDRPTAGLLRPARRGRLGLGDAEGRLLVRRHHHAAGVHPGPRPVRHRPADDRDRRAAPDLQQEPQRHAGQPLPAVRSRRCRARPRSGRSCPGSRTRRSWGSRRRARTRRSWRRASRRSSSAARTGRRRRTASSRPSFGRTATSTAGRPGPPCPRRAPVRLPSSSPGSAFVIGGIDADRRAD